MSAPKTAPETVPGGPASAFRIAMGTGGWLVAAFLALPILVVIPVSLTDTSYIGLPKDGLSLQHYESYFTSARWLGGTAASILGRKFHNRRGPGRDGPVGYCWGLLMK